MKILININFIQLFRAVHYGNEHQPRTKQRTGTY